MIFVKVQVQFRIRIHYLEFRIRIPQKVSDPCGSGSTTLTETILSKVNPIIVEFVIAAFGKIRIKLWPRVSECCS
jgi:hypothetical protein